MAGPLAPAGRQAGAHGGKAPGPPAVRASRLALLAPQHEGLKCCVTLLLPAGEAAGLGGEIVEGSDESVEALADVGGVESVFGRFEG